MGASLLPHQTLLPPTKPFHLVQPATEVRGTLLASSLVLVREDAMEERYFSALPAESRTPIRELLPLSWLSMELAVSHYRAMEAVYPEPEQQVANGRSTAERTQNAYVRTIARGLASTGQLDPAELIKRVADAIERFIRGGGAVAAYRTGPKDARIELVGYPFLAVAYARYGWQGMFESTLGMATRRLFIRQDVRFEREDRVAYLVSWV